MFSFIGILKDYLTGAVLGNRLPRTPFPVQ